MIQSGDVDQTRSVDPLFAVKKRRTKGQGERNKNKDQLNRINVWQNREFDRLTKKQKRKKRVKAKGSVDVTKLIPNRRQIEDDRAGKNVKGGVEKKKKKKRNNIFLRDSITEKEERAKHQDSRRRDKSRNRMAEKEGETGRIIIDPTFLFC